MNIAKKTITVVSTTENYQCSQAVIGQLCIVSYRWLANSIMSTIIYTEYEIDIINIFMELNVVCNWGYVSGTYV